jgi:3-oxoacyl-[acyl-carrier protein] reductase
VNRSAVITGSSSGIGLATARRLLAAGYAVVLNGRDEQRLARAMEELDGSGRVVAVAGDAADESTVAEAVEQALRLGSWTVAVANPGGGQNPVPLAELTEQSLAARLRSNLVPTALLLAAAARELADGGRFVAVSSLAGRRGSLIASADYAASKAGVLGLVRQGARDLAPRGITVNAVAPGIIDVPRVQGLIASGGQPLIDSIPLGRAGVPDEVAAAICFLASDEAGYITGATLDINGGAYMA